MKLKTGEKVHYDAGPNMTPLVDVVMVILIFLMLTGTFAVGEHFLQSNIPMTKKGVGGAPQPNAVPLDEQLEIRVDTFGRIGDESWQAVAGQVRITNNREQLETQLRRMREQYNQNNTPTDKIQVVINPGKTTRYKHLVDVYQAALGAEFKKVAFSTAH